MERHATAPAGGSRRDDALPEGVLDQLDAVMQAEFRHESCLWPSTVLVLMTSVSAMLLVERPSATSRKHVLFTFGQLLIGIGAGPPALLLVVLYQVTWRRMVRGANLRRRQT